MGCSAPSLPSPRFSLAASASPPLPSCQYRSFAKGYTGKLILLGFVSPYSFDHSTSIPLTHSSTTLFNFPCSIHLATVSCNAPSPLNNFSTSLFLFTCPSYLPSLCSSPFT